MMTKSRKIIFVPQRDSMDCAVACLNMIIKFYNRKIEISNQDSILAITKNGATLSGIERIAKSYYLNCFATFLSIEEIMNDAKLPCIIHWNQNHFVVVHKIRKYRKGRYSIHIADPARGLVVYEKEEFLENWISTKTNGEEKGIALLLEPTEQFYTQTDAKAVLTQNRLKFLWGYLKKYKRFFTQLILGLLLGSLLQLVFPFLTQSIVDTGIGGKDIGFVWLVLLAEMMLLFSRTAIDFIRSKILLHISTRINISLISDFFIKLMKLPMKFFGHKRSEHSPFNVRFLHRIASSSTKVMHFVLESSRDSVSRIFFGT